MKIYVSSAAMGVIFIGFGCAAIKHSSAQQKNASPAQKTSAPVVPTEPVALTAPSTSVRATDADVRLERSAPELEVYESNDAQIFYASNVPPKIVKLAAENLKSEKNPQFYKIPGEENVYLAAISEAARVSYVLFKENGDELIEVERSRALEYDDVLDTTFFANGGRVLIVAGVGTAPDFDGLEIFEYRGEKLNYLGAITAAKKEKTAGLHGDYVNPLGAATAEYKSGNYQITMSGDLYSEWGFGAKEKKIAAGSSVTFRFDGDKFKVVKRR